MQMISFIQTHCLYFKRSSCFIIRSFKSHINFLLCLLLTIIYYLTKPFHSYSTKIV